ncbi:hypothetical protein [Klebsiella oxytoca]|uniref:hypothetical protein n=1 Tax=Klebsiella oxytoca TaxID=571 RepID=UPI00157B86A7|nr:hypothetical protein [Klebsiella oxytoca]
MKGLINKKALSFAGACCLFFIAASGHGAVYIQATYSPGISISSTNVSNGIGQTTLNFRSPAGSLGYVPWVSTSGVQTYNYIRAFSIFESKVVMKNKSTGQSFSVPVTCPACQAASSAGFLSAGGLVNFKQTHGSYLGSDWAFSASASVTSRILVSLLDSSIPAGSYEGTIVGSVGQLAESYSGEYLNYASSIISVGVRTGIATVVAMKFDIVIPEYTICTTNSPLTINHGNLTPDQVSGDVKTQNLSIACTGKATIKLSMSTPRPRVGNGVHSHIRMSADNINWAETSNTTLGSRGTQIIYLSSTLETSGTMVPQSLQGSTVITMSYQ